MREPVRTENLKTKISKIYQTARLCRSPKFSQNARTVNFKNLSKPKQFQGANKLTADISIPAIAHITLLPTSFIYSF